MCDTCRLTKPARSWGPTPMRSRSTRSCAARGRGPLGGGRRCIPSRAMWRGCSRSFAPVIKQPKGSVARRGCARGTDSPGHRLFADDAVDQAVFERLLRVQIEVRTLCISDDLLEWPAGAPGEQLVDLRLHLLEAVEMLRRRRRRLPPCP